MSYSVTAILSPYQDAHQLHRVSIQVVYNRIKVYPATEVKVKKNQWKGGSVINHVHKEKLNHLINKQKIEIEGLLLEAMKHKSNFSKADLVSIITGKKNVNHLRFDAFAYSRIEEMKNKLSPGRLRQYHVMIRKVLAYDENTLITDINGAWLQKFENWLLRPRIVNEKSVTLGSGTVKGNINIIKAIIRAADNKELTTANFKGYKNIHLNPGEPDFLTENELQAFFGVARAINKPSHKLAAYYFLLSCFTGLRLGDAKKFNYSTHVRGNEIVVRAKKNGKLVTIPLYTELSEVLDYIQDKPFLLSEDKARKYVKEIASLAGIKKNVKYHTSRHTCTTRLIDKGFPLKYVAAIIGDSVEITRRIYDHVDAQDLKKTVKEKLG